jgi:hypothetical protein
MTSSDKGRGHTDTPLPPQNIEAEQRVLGAIFLNDEVLGEIREVLEVRDFYQNRHRVIFMAMCHLAVQDIPIDYVTLMDDLKNSGKLDDAKGPEYFASLSDDVSSAANVLHHAQMVKDCAKRRELIRIGQSFKEAAHDETRPIDETIDKGMDALSDSFPPPKGGIGKETNFNPISAADLLSEPPEPIEWVWDKYIPKGSLTLLSAYMKVGKSTFAYPLAISVAQGRSFLGYETQKGGVLILAVEEHKRDIRLRLERFEMKENDPIYIHARGLKHSSKTFKEIRKFITENEISLVLLDTLSRFWNIKNENDNAEVIQLISPILDLAHETDTAILLVHHDRKGGGDYGESIRGGSALFANVDQALLLKPRTGGDTTQRILKTLGRYSESPGELIVGLNEDEWIVHGTPKEMGVEGDKRKILEAISEYPKDVKTLAEEADINQKRVKKALDALDRETMKEGKGVKGDPFTYRLEPENSFLSQPYSKGKETNSSEDLGEEGTLESFEEVEVW